MAALRATNPSAQFSWYSIDGKNAREWALPALRLMNQGHCSFCDCYPLEDRSKEPIEHFKPKTHPAFLRGASTWENLYYCCEFCQDSKKDQWDPKLIRPDASDYQFLRFFEFDYTTGAIRPSTFNRSQEDQSRVEVTIKFYGLDKPARRRMRLEYMENYSDQEIDTVAYRDFLKIG